jgi:AcrR family transcriptional regulator
MRSRIVDAAFDRLLAGGYTATTIGAVQTAAGVARGTLLHHFPTRAALLVAVVEDIAERRLRILDDGARPAGWDGVVDLVWRDLRSPSFLAALELWVAARTDAELRAALLPVQARLFAGVHDAVADLLGSTDDPRTPTLVQFTIDLLTGSVMAGLLGDDVETNRVVERWRRTVQALADLPELPWSPSTTPAAAPRC